MVRRKKIITISVPIEFYNKVKKFCEDRNIFISDFFVKAVQEKIEKVEVLEKESELYDIFVKQKN